MTNDIPTWDLCQPQAPPVLTGAAECSRHTKKYQKRLWSINAKKQIRTAGVQNTRGRVWNFKKIEEKRPSSNDVGRFPYAFKSAEAKGDFGLNPFVSAHVTVTLLSRKW